MDVLLIYPNVSLSSIEDEIKVPPLGLAYIAAVLEENGYNVEILDMYAQHTTLNELRNILKRGQPEIVGITCLTPFVSTVLKIARMVKAINAKVVVGGAHATALPEEMLKEEAMTRFTQ